MSESQSPEQEGQQSSSEQKLAAKLKSKMKKGYFKMGKINLELAEEGIKAEKETYDSF